MESVSSACLLSNGSPCVPRARSNHLRCLEPAAKLTPLNPRASLRSQPYDPLAGPVRIPVPKTSQPSTISSPYSRESGKKRSLSRAQFQSSGPTRPRTENEDGAGQILQQKAHSDSQEGTTRMKSSSSFQPKEECLGDPLAYADAESPLPQTITEPRSGPPLAYLETTEESDLPQLKPKFITLPEFNIPQVDSAGAETQIEEIDSGELEFRWEKHWYPVALIEDLDPGIPHPFTLLGKDMVLWRDNQEVWRAHRDMCPHRLAPLSEGRIDDKTGDLQCSYHGWTFRGDGTCSGIPQAESTGAEERAVRSSRACVAVYPTLVSQGLLFVWPEEGNWAEALGKEPPKLPPDFEDKERFSTVTIQRDLFYGYDVLMENVSDPSHIEFAHHAVTGNRSRAKPLPFTMSELTAEGFTAEAPGNPGITTWFLPPCGAFSRLQFSLDIPFFGTQNVDLWICSFNIPMAPGKTRSIVLSARNFARLTVPGGEWWQVFPRWLEHLTSNKVYDGDMIVLQGQEKALSRHTSQPPANATSPALKPKSYGSLTFTPTKADRGVLAFRNWLRRFGGGGPRWDPECFSEGGVTPPLPSTVLGKKEMLDRLTQHTLKCSSCKKAYENTQKLALVLFGMSAALVASASLPGDVRVKAALAGAGLLCLGLGAYLKLVLEPQFVFVDYVHADIP